MSAPASAPRRSTRSRKSTPNRASAPDGALRRGVILDRDGTLIDFVRDVELGAVVSAFHPAQLRLLPGVIEGLRLLAAHGFVLAIATNQPGAAKGQIPREAIARTNDALVGMLRAQGIVIAASATCPHHPEGGPGGDASLVGPCECRKPKPGMVLSLIAALSLDPRATFMVGDTMHDVEAGAAAGTRTGLLVELGRCELCPLKESPTPTSAQTTLRSPVVHPGLVAPRFDLLARAIVDSLT